MIVGYGRVQRTRVVVELIDLGRGFVYEAEYRVVFVWYDAHGLVGEELIVGVFVE